MTNESLSQTTSNIFSLIRLRPECKIFPTRVDFSTINKSSSTQISITPSFNNDRSFYTPSFTLPTDIKLRHQNLHLQKCQFEEKIQRCLQDDSNYSPPSKQNIDAAAPNSNYCQVCQEKFEDYFAHNMLKSHQIRMTKSEGSDEIRKLCQQFQDNLAVHSIQSKTKNIKKEQRRQQKKVKGIKLNPSNNQANSTVEGFTKLQNHSTGIIQDTLI